MTFVANFWLSGEIVRHDMARCRISRVDVRRYCRVFLGFNPVINIIIRAGVCLCFLLTANAIYAQSQNNVISGWHFDGWEKTSLPKCADAQWAVFCNTNTQPNELVINVEINYTELKGNFTLFVTSSGPEKVVISGLTQSDCEKNVDLLNGLVVTSKHKLEASCLGVTS